jgi:hypothetical protein
MLAQDRNAVYTYSEKFQSQTIELVNMAELDALEKAAQRAKYTTKRGFVYPAPKEPSEYAKLDNSKEFIHSRCALNSVSF